MEVAREIVATITDPSAMVGPEASIATIMHMHNKLYILALRLDSSMIKYLVTMLPSRKRRKVLSSSKYCTTH